MLALFAHVWDMIMNSVFIVDDHPVIRLAIGDVLRDQLSHMRQCGFDAFAVREDCRAQGTLPQGRGDRALLCAERYRRLAFLATVRP